MDAVNAYLKGKWLDSNAMPDFDSLVVNAQVDLGGATRTFEKLSGSGSFVDGTVVLIGDLVVTVPEESRSAKQVILEKGRERKIEVRPAVKNITVTLPAASLSDFRDDRQRLLDALEQETGLKHLSVDYPVLKELPQILREGSWTVTATIWQEKEVIRVAPGKRETSLGAAVDVGTTTLAAFLCDLTTGEVLAKASRMNPQIGYGEDVLARISYAVAESDGRKKLQDAIIEAINAHQITHIYSRHKGTYHIPTARSERIVAIASLLIAFVQRMYIRTAIVTNIAIQLKIYIPFTSVNK
jgi:uncharacterized 2Fe-2S/4Fe-4S cluster protein (DUF4445 family)